MSREVRNEQRKLLANWLDRASTSCLTVGVVTPAAGYVLGVSGLTVLSVAAACYVWLVVAWSLHRFARRVLGRLE